MKIFFLIFCFFTSSILLAEEQEILNEVLHQVDTRNSKIISRFQVDTIRSEVLANVKVFETRIMLVGGRPIKVPVIVFEKISKIEGLVISENKLIYQGLDENIVCGTIANGRFSNTTQIKLTGPCALSSRILRNFPQARIVVKFVTKD